MTYQKILKQELETRILRNPSYSLRSFAKNLGLSAPHLSDILNAKKGLSLTSAHRIAEVLKFQEDEKQVFCDLVVIKHSKNAQDVKAAKLRLKENRQKNSFQDINTEEFKLVSEWYHLAILHLIELKEFEPNPEWIAKKLSLPIATIKDALDRLEKANLIKRDNEKWQLVSKFVTTNNAPKAALKNFHHQILSKAAQSIDQQSSAERDLSAIILSCSDEKLPEAKEWIKTFRRKFCDDLDKSKVKNRVYCLAIQFFKVSHTEV